MSHGRHTVNRKVKFYANLPQQFGHILVKSRAAHCPCHKCTKFVEASSIHSEFKKRLFSKEKNDYLRHVIRPDRLGIPSSMTDMIIAFKDTMDEIHLK